MVSSELSQEDAEKLIRLYSDGHFNEVESVAKNLINYHPDTPILFELLSAAELGQGKMDSAVLSLRRLNEIARGNPDTLCNLGAVLKELCQLEESIKCLRQAVKIKPNSPQILCNLGIALHELGQLDESIRCLRKASQIDPSLSKIGRAHV